MPCSSARKARHAWRGNPRLPSRACKGGLCATGMQLRGSGQGPSCSGISIASRLLAVWLALLRFKNAAIREAFTRPYGQYCDRCVHQPPRRSTPSLSHFACRNSPAIYYSLESETNVAPVHVPGGSLVQPTSSHVPVPFRRRRLHPRGPLADLQTLRGCSGRPVLPPRTRSLPAVFLLSEGTLCTDVLAHSWPRAYAICVSSPSEPSRTDPVQGQGGRGAIPFSGALLAQSDLVPRTDAPRDSPSLANSSEEGSPFSERGHPLAPASRLVESPRMVPGWDTEVLGGLPPAVVNTITSARAPSTRHVYRLEVEPVYRLVFSPLGGPP